MDKFVKLNTYFLYFEYLYQLCRN